METKKIFIFRFLIKKYKLFVQFVSYKPISENNTKENLKVYFIGIFTIPSVSNNMSIC